jgi:hypothetical protein
MNYLQRGNRAAVWQSIVTNYSRKLLTYESDRLPALSGIAHQFKSSGFGAYRAGLWQDNLVLDLVWQADHLSGHIDHPEQYIQSDTLGRPERVAPFAKKMKRVSPSWSWISTPLPVRRTDVTARTLEPYDNGNIWYVTADCELGGADPMGRVLSGRVLMQVRMVSFRLQNIDREGNFVLVGVDPEENFQGVSARLIPDLPIGKGSQCGLAVGETVHAAQLFSYHKDGQLSWVALAIRHVDDVSLSDDKLRPDLENVENLERPPSRVGSRRRIANGPAILLNQAISYLKKSYSPSHAGVPAPMPVKGAHGPFVRLGLIEDKLNPLASRLDYDWFRGGDEKIFII